MVELLPVKDRPFPFVNAERVAVGVPPAIPVTANLADAVEIPPRRKS